ncbi:MAG: sigma-70 family RNA polymerase sigma factor [Acidobacteria bacterium]|nr:sigma-70 family RNA polymerase sigma factor [Acidobacteriota bacterium]
MGDSPGEITLLLQAAAHGDSAAESRLIELVFPDLLRLARHYMDRERPGHTLQPTALVNEVYLRVIGGEPATWQNRAHFFAVAATLMRRILVDYARERKAAKRGGGNRQVELEDRLALTELRIDEILEVDEALSRLALLDDRQSRIVELRFFGGMTEEEIAEMLKISVRTVKRDWSVARAWLHAELRARPQ